MTRKAVLIVNPAAGRVWALRTALPTMIAMLHEHGYEVEVVETTPVPHVGDAAWHAFAASGSSLDLTIACGGDGTVHSVVQTLASLKSQVPLGVIPTGTANALARNLGLSMDPVAALEKLLNYEPRRIPLGHVTTGLQARWFCLMAGCGPAGALVEAMAAGSRLKRRFGRVAYYIHAARLFVTRCFPAFRMEFRNAAGVWQSTHAVAMMACWVPDLGGLFSGVTHKASVMDERLHVQVVGGPAWLSLPLWMLFGARGPWVWEMEPDELRCLALDERKVYVQADAEPLGALPFELRVVKDAVVMLLPKRAG